MSVCAHRAASTALAIAAIAVAVYANSLGNGFVWDDERIVLGGPAGGAVTRPASVLLSPLTK